MLSAKLNWVKFKSNSMKCLLCVVRNPRLLCMFLVIPGTEGVLFSIAYLSLLSFVMWDYWGRV